MNDSENCKTCAVYISNLKRRKHKHSCFIRNQRLNKVCPCRTCLFKISCYYSSDGCEKHNELYDWALERRNERRKI